MCLQICNVMRVTCIPNAVRERTDEEVLKPVGAEAGGGEAKVVKLWKGMRATLVAWNFGTTRSPTC